MMKKKLLLAVSTALLTISSVTESLSQIVYRPQPEEWESLVPGGSFIDRFLPMPEGKLSMDNWGSLDVQPRYVDNGIEDDVVSYWGGNIIKGNDGKYHMYVCGWDENNANGHMGYKTESNVYHATCDNSIGPFKIQQHIGHGHNTEVVILKSGEFMVYSIGGYDETKDCIGYFSKNYDGPWEKRIIPLDLRDRKRYPGSTNWFHNMAFAKREDGSVLMVNRGGLIWVSIEGDSVYNLISNGTAYPKVDGRYEDPVIWKDNVQYNMIVNDWIGRTAFYLRSKDGKDWVVDPGQAYAPGISKHKDGRVENWHKYERIRIFQDEYGRAIQANFAVIDTLKHDDLMDDNHSSKNIAIPMNKGMLLELLETKPIERTTKTITVKIKGEEGFNPATDLDINSLRFGASTEVNYGRGAEVKSSKVEGNDLIVVFNALNNCITPDDFAPKMLGKDKNGEMVFGYCRVPWLDYEPAMLSARKPIVKGSRLSVPVENFGMSASKDAFLTISSYNDKGVLTQIGSALIPAIKAYGRADVMVYNCSVSTASLKGKEVVVKISTGTEKAVLLNITL